MDKDVKDQLENFDEGLNNDSGFIRCYLSSMFSESELLGKSVTGRKNRAGESKEKIDPIRMNLLKSKSSLTKIYVTNFLKLFH